MSYSVFYNNEFVWGPSLTVGNYFLSSIKQLEKLIESESGIKSDLADTININAAKLSNFVNKILDFIEKNK